MCKACWQSVNYILSSTCCVNHSFLAPICIGWSLHVDVMLSQNLVQDPSKALSSTSFRACLVLQGVRSLAATFDYSKQPSCPLSSTVVMAQALHMMTPLQAVNCMLRTPKLGPGKHLPP
jgi:hypothetical protein